jgi:hypothetical protein
MRNNQNRIKLKTLYILTIMPLLIACGGDDPSSPTGPGLNFGFNYNDFTLNRIDYPDRWYNNLSPLGFEFNFPHDENGIRLQEYNGEYHYHPWLMSRMGVWYLASYLQTSDSLYLDILYRYANKLDEIGVRVDSAIFLPYQFDFPLHGLAFNEIMMAPWYSGMAQGVALSFLIRSYDKLGDPYLKALADSIYYSFFDFSGDRNIWITAVDTLDYLWFEEYPFNPNTHVLNGFIFAIEGLYDYWYVTGDENCAILIKASLTTVMRYFDGWRNPGGYSFYCIRHRVVLGSYHGIHINMLRYMGDVTSDSTFYNYADSLESDHAPQ